MRTVIEKVTKLHEAGIKAASSIFENAGMEQMKLYVAIYHPELKVGKGGHHVWYSDSSTKERLAITYLD